MLPVLLESGRINLVDTSIKAKMAARILSYCFAKSSSTVFAP